MAKLGHAVDPHARGLYFVSDVDVTVMPMRSTPLVAFLRATSPNAGRLSARKSFFHLGRLPLANEPLQCESN